MEYPRALSLDQSCSLSTLTQLAQSFIPTVASTTMHFYADDTQLYITLSPENFSHSIQKLKNCLNDIQNFMFANKLKLNPDKTEFILIGSQKIVTNSSLTSLSIFRSLSKSGLSSTKCQEPRSGV